MNALQPTLSADTQTYRPDIPTAWHPALNVAEQCLELTLPSGWMLSDSRGCQLKVIRGCLWLTDTRGQDLWLKDGDSELLTTKTLLTAECETVVQLRPAIDSGNPWQQRLQVTAKHQHMQLQLTKPSFWQRCIHLFGAL